MPRRQGFDAENGSVSEACAHSRRSCRKPVTQFRQRISGTSVRAVGPLPPMIAPSPRHCRTRGSGEAKISRTIKTSPLNDEITGIPRPRRRPMRDRGALPRVAATGAASQCARRAAGQRRLGGATGRRHRQAVPARRCTPDGWRRTTTLTDILRPFAMIGTKTLPSAGLP
jgi:hypothetical protein